MSVINVTKRDGSKEPLDLEKFHKVVSLACDGIANVSASEVEIQSKIQFYDGISSRDIQETLIKAAAQLITEETPEYQYVAGRLINYQLRKEVYGSFEPPHLFYHVSHVVAEGYYDAEILDKYSRKDWDKLEKWIDHTRDEGYVFAAMQQFRSKYLVRNRLTKKYYETPQMAYMLIAATLFADYPADTRLKFVKRYYDAISKHKISLPTPVMSGVRTKLRQFASCVLIDVGDSLDSIGASSAAMYKYIAQKAGLGINFGRVRDEGEPIRNGEASTTGKRPYIRAAESIVKSCSQGSVRGGSATVNLPVFTREFNELVVLKNNKGVPDSRIRKLDYCFHMNRVMYERIINNDVITLMSPNAVPGLYEAFYNDVDEFRRLYEAAEKNVLIRKEVVSAKELWEKLVQERVDTGRIYIFNADHVNDHGSFIAKLATVFMTNLCVEITLPTSPIQDVYKADGEIATCILSAINWGLIDDPADFEDVCELAVRGLDSIIDYQNYPVEAARAATLARRSIGVGVINLAYFLAKRGIRYQDVTAEQLGLIDEYAEAWSYYLIKASNQLAKEKGACPKFNETKYSQGIFPKNTYKKAVDELTDRTPTMPWANLRVDVLAYGMANSTLMAGMPAETSAVIANATNGFQPARALITTKGSKDAYSAQVVPEIRKLRDAYDLEWDQVSPRGYLKIMAVFQKWMDQAISVNTSYNPAHYPDTKLSLDMLTEDLLLAYKWGLKTLYYNNTLDNAGDEQETPTTERVAEPDVPSDAEEDCESCKI